MGLSDDGLPLGLQVMTPRFTDRKTLGIGRLLEDMLGFDHYPAQLPD
jgi:Asp-tRNA(Asn)/Glu-tRNA(Gln) amidotransferase A subunit family amidase